MGDMTEYELRSDVDNLAAKVYHLEAELRRVTRQRDNLRDALEEIVDHYIFFYDVDTLKGIEERPCEDCTDMQRIAQNALDELTTEGN